MGADLCELSVTATLALRRVRPALCTSFAPRPHRAPALAVPLSEASGSSSPQPVASSVTLPPLGSASGPLLPDSTAAPHAEVPSLQTPFLTTASPSHARLRPHLLACVLPGVRFLPLLLFSHRVTLSFGKQTNVTEMHRYSHSSSQTKNTKSFRFSPLHLSVLTCRFYLVSCDNLHTSVSPTLLNQSHPPGLLIATRLSCQLETPGFFSLATPQQFRFLAPKTPFFPASFYF